jgi:hypothetical protein
VGADVVARSPRWGGTIVEALGMGWCGVEEYKARWSGVADSGVGVE